MRSNIRLHPEGDGGLPGPVGAPSAARRAGSVVLRDDGPRVDPGSMLDPANQSLADALRIMLVLLQGAMLVLGVLYVLSGLQSVNEDERGIRLVFGKIVSSDVAPGFVWGAPYPLGQLIKVNQGGRAEVIDREFWPDYPMGSDPSPDKLTTTASLKPGTGGSVLTADGNIAHTKWKVEYHVRNASEYAQNILSQDEERKLVRSAAKRGIVHASARVTIDELLTQSSETVGSVRSFAKMRAQEILDQAGSGLEIDQMSPDMTIPPLFVRADFARVQSAVSIASKAADEAKAEAAKTLQATAGQAGARLIERIEAYEAATARRLAAERSGDATGVAQIDQTLTEILDSIDSLLQGEAVDLPAGNVVVAGKATPLPAGEVSSLAGGEVARILGDAAAYRTGVVNRTQAEFRRFEAKLAQFNVNPKLMLQSELAEARGVFLGRDSVQQFLLPAGISTISLILNNDPDIAREIQRAQKERERIRAEDQRMRMLQDNTYKTETGLQETPR